MKKIMSLLLSLLMLISVGVVNVSAEESEEHQHLSTSEGIIVKEATCKELGLIQYTCDECKETYEEEIPIKGHNFVDGICSTCGEHEPYETWIIEKTDDQIYEEYIKLASKENVTSIEELLACLSDEQNTALNIKIEENKEPEQEEQFQMLMMAPLLGGGQEEGIKTKEDFASALAEGGEIKLGANIDYESATKISISKETTIDLKGHTLNITTLNTNGESESIVVGSSSSDTQHLTIKDSSDNMTGVLNIINNTTNSYPIDVYGILEIQGGTINITAGKSGAYGIYLNGSYCTFKMSGGVLNRGEYSSGVSSGVLGAGKTLYGSSAKKEVTGGAIKECKFDSAWTITDGIFGVEPAYDLLEPGKIAYKITEGTYKDWYGIKEGSYIGMVGTTMYYDIDGFASAFGGDNIKVDGTKLTLKDNINLSSASANKVTFLSDITIDLAGHSITGQINGSSAYMFYVNQKNITVTITDSVGDGLIKNDGLNATSTKYANTIGVNKGTLVVNNGVTLEAYTSQSNPASTVSTYPTPISVLTSDAKAVLDGAKIKINCGDTKRASANGIVVSGGICEVDNSEISVISGSSATGIKSSSSTATLKIGSKNEGITTIAAETTGINNQVSSVYGIGNSSSGASGNIFVSNVDITVIGNEGGGNQVQTNGGIRFNSMTNGSYEIGNNVSILVKGTTATGKGTELYGIYAKGGGSITGSNVHVDVEGENAAKRYGMYKNNTNPFIINPGADVTIDVNKNGYDTGENILFYAFSTGMFVISGGTYKGGTINGVLATGGTFDSDPSAYCDLGYVAQESGGLWTIVPDTRIIVKNLTQDKEYGNIVTAIKEAKDHDELQLMKDISSNSEVTLKSINLDLNGHNISLKRINTEGDVTITDKQATSFENAGKITAAINVVSGTALVSKVHHAFITNDYNINPFAVSGTADALTQLNISGVNGEYEYTSISAYEIIDAKANSRVTIGNESGFETSLSIESVGTSGTYIINGATNNCETTINGGAFSVKLTSTAVASLFSSSTKVLINDGEFQAISEKNTAAKISGSANANIDIQGGYFVGTGTDGAVTKDEFFTNATSLGQNGKNSVDLVFTDPMYTAGYRYTVDEVAIAKIGTEEYTSIQSAINAAVDGDVITLLSNTVARELVLDKNVTFEGNYTVLLVGDKLLTLGNGLDVPTCFDISDAEAYIEKKNGEKIYYRTFRAYTTSGTIGAYIDFNANTDEQIALVKDVSLTSSWVINKDCTIDLNGYTILDNGCQYEMITVRKDITCTIKDSSNEQTGKISGKNNDFYTICLDDEDTNFVLESGTIENTSENGAAICAVGTYEKSNNTTITINGGKVITNYGFAIVDNGQYSKNNNITINGGEITSSRIAIYHPASGTITLNGGKVAGETGIYIRSGKLVVPEKSTVKVVATGNKTSHGTETGGAYSTGDAIVIDVSGYPGGSPSADIAGGAFYSLYSFAISSYSSYGNTPAIKGFLKGGIYGANSDRIDIMDFVNGQKELIAEGYKDILNPDKTTKEDYPWMIGAVHENETTVVIGNGDTPIEAEIDDSIKIIAKPVIDGSGNDTNNVTPAPGYKLNEPEDTEDGNKLYTAEALEIGEDYQGGEDGDGIVDSKKDATVLEKPSQEVSQGVKNSAESVNDTSAHTQIEKIVHDNLADILIEKGINQGTAAKALNKEYIIVTNEGGTGSTAAKNVNVFVLTYYETKVEEDKTTEINKSYKLDITPVYQAYASTAEDKDSMETEGENKNSVKIGDSAPVDCTGKTITLKVQLPDGFITSTSQKVYVRHTTSSGIKTYNTKVLEESGHFFVEFTNPDGFSVFEFTLENPNPIPGPTPSSDPKPRYKVPNTGVEGTYSNNHSLLKLSSLSLLAIGTYIAIKKKKDNEQ